jgi:hypothetical protein
MLDDLKSVSDLVNMSILRSEYLILQISETDPKSPFYGRLREVTDAQRPLLPRPFAGEKKERKRDRQTRPGAKT